MEYFAGHCGAVAAITQPAYAEMIAANCRGLRWLAVDHEENRGSSVEEADRIAADLTGVDLMMFTRYVGKLSYELELYSGDALDSARGRRLFAGVMGARTGFRYDPRMWQFDRDGGYYSADYLRAWLAEAALEERLRERFGAEWWASRQAGEWLRRQWRRGSLPEAEETVAEEGGRPWSGEALDRVFSGRLPEPNASR